MAMEGNAAHHARDCFVLFDARSRGDHRVSRVALVCVEDRSDRRDLLARPGIGRRFHSRERFSKRYLRTVVLVRGGRPYGRGRHLPAHRIAPWTDSLTMPTINKPIAIITGDSAEILETSAMTGGAYTRIRIIFKPGGLRVPSHRHLLQDETYEVISGTMTYTLDGKVHQAGPGTTVTLPKSVLHEHYTTGPGDAVTIQTMSPGLDFDYLVENLFGLGSIGRGVNPIDAFIQGMVWIRKAKGTFYVAMPIWLQRGLAMIICPIAYL